MFLCCTVATSDNNNERWVRGHDVVRILILAEVVFGGEEFAMSLIKVILMFSDGWPGGVCV